MQVANRDIWDCISTDALIFACICIHFAPHPPVQDCCMKPDDCYLLGPARSEMAPSPVAALGSPMCGYPAGGYDLFYQTPS